jgi:hypothetical protein
MKSIDPWSDVPLIQIPALVTAGERPELPSTCPEEFKTLIKACWKSDPAARYYDF